MNFCCCYAVGHADVLSILCIFPAFISSVQLLNCVQLFVTPWTAAHQASLSITSSWSLLKNHVRLVSDAIQPSHPLLPLLLLLWIFPSTRLLSKESVLHIRWPKYSSFNFSINLPMNIQDLFPSGLTGLISLLSKRLLRVFSNTTVQKHQFFGAQLSSWFNSHIHTWLLEKS